jgi:2-polyprenyl-6-hydroxyphenyl methylase/3-demethylubiquinone-9 3-methyltransferase
MSTVDPINLQTFADHASQWWDEHGPFKPLHALNPQRLQFIQTHIRRVYPEIQHLNIIDVGCGGGLACEPFARLRAQVTGLDASVEAIKAAKAHASGQGLDITYQVGTVDDISAHATFDVVLALEVAEHVQRVEHFVSRCFALLKPGGLLFISTLNRTWRSYLQGIVAAEYILRWVPRGTHTWGQFLTPAEVGAYLNEHGAHWHDLSGISYKPLRRTWQLTADLSVNYIGVTQKPL